MSWLNRQSLHTARRESYRSCSTKLLPRPSTSSQFRQKILILVFTWNPPEWIRLIIIRARIWISAPIRSCLASLTTRFIIDTQIHSLIWIKRVDTWMCMIGLADTHWVTRKSKKSWKSSWPRKIRLLWPILKMSSMDIERRKVKLNSTYSSKRPIWNTQKKI